MPVYRSRSMPACSMRTLASAYALWLIRSHDLVVNPAKRRSGLNPKCTMKRCSISSGKGPLTSKCARST